MISTGNAPSLASSYALVRPMPRIAPAVSTLVVVPSLRTALIVQVGEVGVRCVVAMVCPPRSVRGRRVVRQEDGLQAEPPARGGTKRGRRLLTKPLTIR